MKLRVAWMLSFMLAPGGSALHPFPVAARLKAKPTALYVSPGGSPGHRGGSCRDARLSNIQTAVNIAKPGATIHVCPGTYTFWNQGGRTLSPLVKVNKPVKLAGTGAVIDASGPTSATGSLIGIAVTDSYVVISGFTVTGAVDEGIAALPDLALAATGEAPADPVAPLTNIRIVDNTVNGNDRGFVPPGGCLLPSEYPGSCGGAIHLNDVEYSSVVNNRVTDDSEGILITDDAGPTSHNYVSRNTIAGNSEGSGIALISHNSQAAGVRIEPSGTLTVTSENKSRGGIFDTLVTANSSDDNGTTVGPNSDLGSGAGVLIETTGPGTATYANTVSRNYMIGNGLAGIVMHGRYPGGDTIAGNVVMGNTIRKNNLEGDALDNPWTTETVETTGITIESAASVKLSISGNTISNDTLGIWHSRAVSLAGLNDFRNVSNRYETADRPFGSAWCIPLSYSPQICTANTDASYGMSGFVVPNGSSTTYAFKYGTNPNVLSSVTATKTAGSGVIPIGVKATITNLLARTTYFYELVATNVHGTVTGSEISFTTP